MFSRLSQVARHLQRPGTNITRACAPTFIQQKTRVNGFMASKITADERNSRTIHTAACLVIGDEVLGGKAGLTKVVGGGD
jgi:hypothetical protein